MTPSENVFHGARLDTAIWLSPPDGQDLLSLDEVTLAMHGIADVIFKFTPESQEHECVGDGLDCAECINNTAIRVLRELAASLQIKAQIYDDLTTFELEQSMHISNGIAHAKPVRVNPAMPLDMEAIFQHPSHEVKRIRHQAS